MKDYSNFINGFITKYEIKDNEILIYTPHTKKNEPIIKPLTKENLKKCEVRLENQYKMIAEHQEEIIKFNNKKIAPLYLLLLVLGGVITIMFFLLLGTTIISRIILGTYILSSIITSCIIELKDNNFRKEVKRYLKYMKNRENIEELAKIDENVTAYLNEETLSLIEENKKLNQQGIIDSVYNIDLMDKMSLKELKKLLLRYHICESINSVQQFRIPEQNHKIKTKKLIKEEQNQ